MPSSYVGTDTFTASYDIPSGGDTRNATGVNTALEALGNRTKYLQNRLGLMHLVWETPYDPGAGSAMLCSSTSQFWNNVSGNNYNVASFAVNANDVVEVVANPIVITDGVAAKVAEARMGYSLDGGVTISGNQREVKLLIPAAPSETQITVLGRLSMAATDTIDLYLQARSPDDTTTIELLRPCLFLVKLWRPVT